MFNVSYPNFDYSDHLSTLHSRKMRSLVALKHSVPHTILRQVSFHGSYINSEAMRLDPAPRRDLSGTKSQPPIALCRSESTVAAAAILSDTPMTNNFFTSGAY